jgi:hypothetical protein
MNPISRALTMSALQATTCDSRVRVGYGSSSPSNALSEMDKETFDVMWNMSAPEGPATGCFLRIPQVEYYADAKPRPHELEHMPDVSSPNTLARVTRIIIIII